MKSQKDRCRNSKSCSFVCANSHTIQYASCRLLRWGTSTAAELVAADNANTVAQLSPQDPTCQSRLLRWGSSTVADLAAAEAAHGHDELGIELGQEAADEGDWAGLTLAELARQESLAASARQEADRPAARTASR